MGGMRELALFIALEMGSLAPLPQRAPSNYKRRRWRLRDFLRAAALAFPTAAAPLISPRTRFR